MVIRIDSSRPLRAIAAFLFVTCITTGQQYLVSTVAGGAPTPAPAMAVTASINPTILTVDNQGNVYFVSGVAALAIYKIDRGGTLTRVAGTGRLGSDPPDGTLATSGQIFASGIATDRAGNVYFSERQRVRKISAGGIVTTVAGTGAAFSGDGGQAVSAGFDAPAGLEFDTAGNLYVADKYRIRKISTNGIVTTIAGNGVAGYSGDGGPAVNASLSNFPISELTVDSAGNVYFIAVNELKVRKVSVEGAITTFAGSGKQGIFGDGGPAINAGVEILHGLTMDASGNLLIGDDWRIRKVSPDGIISAIAGTVPGFLGDNGAASAARFSNIGGMHVGPDGSLLLADVFNYRVRKILPNGIVTTIAGTGYGSYSGDSGPASDAQTNFPISVAIDKAGNVYFTDSTNNRVRKIAPDKTITTFAGDGAPGTTLDGQLAVQAHFAGTAGVAVGSDDSVYISDPEDAIIWKVTPDGRIHRIAGGLSDRYAGDGGQARDAGFFTPWGLTFDSKGNLFVADENDHRIRKISPDGIISTVAGNGSRTFSGDGGPATSAGLNFPQTVAIDAEGNFFIADNNNGRVRKVSTNGIISTVAGNGASSPGTNGYGDNGPATSAYLGLPFGVLTDNTGNLYISGAGGIRKVSANGIITSVAGASARGLAMDDDGDIYFADESINAIAVLQPYTSLAVSNAASNYTDVIAPGEIVTLYGANLGPSQLLTAGPGQDGMYDAQLAGTIVSFNGIAAPMIYTSANQAAAIVPYELSAGSAEVTVTYQGHTALTYRPVQASVPGIFTADSTGKGQAAAVNQDNSINGPASPAKIGDVISLYMTGEGQTAPGAVDGKPGTPPYSKPNLQVTAKIGGLQATVQYAGGAFGEVAGLMQVNVQIPSGVQTGDAVPVVVQVGTYLSQTGVTIAVR